MKTVLSKVAIPQPTEHQIQSACIQYLRVKGWYVMRLNSGKMAYQYKGKTGFVSMGEVGTPDLMCFKSVLFTDGVHIVQNPHTILYFIEVKRPKKVPTIHQEHKMAELEEYGAKCIVVHSVEELEQLI